MFLGIAKAAQFEEVLSSSPTSTRNIHQLYPPRYINNQCCGSVAEFIDKVNSGMGCRTGTPGYMAGGPVRLPYAGIGFYPPAVKDL